MYPVIQQAIVLLLLRASSCILITDTEDDSDEGNIFRAVESSFEWVKLEWGSPTTEVKALYLQYGKTEDGSSITGEPLDPFATEYQAEGLDCGNAYTFKLFNFYEDGSMKLFGSTTAKTLADENILFPRTSELLKESSDHTYVLLLDEWPAINCRVKTFHLSYKSVHEANWTDIEFLPAKRFQLPALHPDVWYQLIVTAQLGENAASHIYGMFGHNYERDSSLLTSYPPEEILLDRQGTDLIIFLENWDTSFCLIESVEVQYKTRDYMDDWKTVNEFELQDKSQLTVTQLRPETAYILMLERKICREIVTENFTVTTLRVDGEGVEDHDLFTKGPSFFNFHWTKYRSSPKCTVKKWKICVSPLKTPDFLFLYETDKPYLKVKDLEANSSYTVKVTAVICEPDQQEVVEYVVGTEDGPLWDNEMLEHLNMEEASLFLRHKDVIKAEEDALARKNAAVPNLQATAFWFPDLCAKLVIAVLLLLINTVF